MLCVHYNWWSSSFLFTLLAIPLPLSCVAAVGSLSVCGREGKHMEQCAWRSRDNPQSSFKTALWESDIVDCQARWPTNVWDFTCLLQSLNRSSRTTDTCYQVWFTRVLGNELRSQITLSSTLPIEPSSQPFPLFPLVGHGNISLSLLKCYY